MTSAEYKKISSYISQICDGNINVFADIYSMYEKKVFFLCCKITGSKTASAEITKDTFSYVFKNISHISNISLFDKWVYVAATSRCKAFFKKTDNTKYEEYKDNDDIPTDDIDAVLAIDEKKNVKAAGSFEITVEKMKATDKIIAELPQKVRIAFIHYYLSGLSFEEIAQYESITINAVKNRILYARINLQSSVNEAIASGQNLRGLIPAMSYMLETMAESVIVPREIATQVTLATGVPCISSESEYATADDNTNSEEIIPEQQFINTSNVSGVNINNRTSINKDGGYSSHNEEEFTESEYYEDEDEEEISRPHTVHKAEAMTPTVKILIGVICVLILVIGAIAVSVFAKNHKKEDETDLNEVTVTTVAETKSKKTKTTKATTETTKETTTETTTQSTTQPTTQPTTQETTTQAPIPVYTEQRNQPQDDNNEEQPIDDDEAQGGEEAPADENNEIAE